MVFFLTAEAAAADLFVSSAGSNQIIRYDGRTGAFIAPFVPAGSGGLKAPRGLVFPRDHNLVVANGGANNILTYDRKGAFLRELVTSGSGGLSDPRNMILGRGGRLVIGNFTDASILRFDAKSGAFVDVFVASKAGGLKEPRGFAFGPGHDLYVANASTVLRFDGAKGTPEPVPGQAGAIFVASGSGGLSVANGLAFDPRGNLYVANQDKHQILRFNGKSGAFIGVFIAADSGGLKEPRGIGFGPDGNLYVTDAGDDAVRRYNGKTGRPLPAAGKSGAVFVSPGSGNLKAPAFLVFR